MGYGGDDDLSSNERALLGISPGHSVYLIRNSSGDVVSIKAVDHVSNRENVIDLRTPMRREGQVSIADAAKMVYQGMRRLPQNYIVVMDSAGQISRGTLSGLVGYSPEESKDRNAKSVSGAVGNLSLLASFTGGSKKRVLADSYGPGDSGAFYSSSAGSDSYKGESRTPPAKGGNNGGGDFIKNKGVALSGGANQPPSLAELVKEFASEEDFSRQKNEMESSLSLKRRTGGRKATVNYSKTYAEDLTDLWESSVF